MVESIPSRFLIDFAPALYPLIIVLIQPTTHVSVFLGQPVTSMSYFSVQLITFLLKSL